MVKTWDGGDHYITGSRIWRVSIELSLVIMGSEDLRRKHLLNEPDFISRTYFTL